MREIKFRALRKDDRGFAYGSLNTNDIHHGTSILTHGVLTYAVIKGTVGQFTGLKDKNGTEIYEGDVLNSKYFKNGVVVFWRYGWYVKTSKYCHNSLSTLIHSFEIIGNIHQNLELL